jgi:chromosome segregation ATPase
MKVNKKLAAQMVNIGRTTFYRHITEKPISVDANGQIDVSELIRVYGSDNVKTPEQLKQSRNKPTEHDGTQKNSSLEAEVSRLKSELEKVNLERNRERSQLTEQIENLQSSLKQSMEQNGNLTRLLTDGRSDEEKQNSQKQKEQDEKIESILKTLQSMNEEKPKTLWQKIFG